jgi:hypothetical protein
VTASRGTRESPCPRLPRVPLRRLRHGQQSRLGVSVGIDRETAPFGSRPTADDAGGTRRARIGSPEPVNYSSRPMAEGTTIIRRGCGRCLCGLWPMDFGLTLDACHFAPGITRCNKIEHRLFGLIHAKLAWTTTGQPPGDRQSDRRHDAQDLAHVFGVTASALDRGHEVVGESHVVIGLDKQFGQGSVFPARAVGMSEGRRIKADSASFPRCR